VRERERTKTIPSSTPYPTVSPKIKDIRYCSRLQQLPQRVPQNPQRPPQPPICTSVSLSPIGRSQRSSSARLPPRYSLSLVFPLSASTGFSGGALSTSFLRTCALPRCCGRTNLNYTGSSTRVHSRGLRRTSNGIIPWPVG
jgi:hypothetical protein